MNSNQDNKEVGMSRRSRRKNSKLSDENFMSFYEKCRRSVKGLDFILVLTLSVILGAVIATMAFSTSDSNVGQDEYTSEHVITLEGISVPTLSAVVGERHILGVEANIIPGAISSEVFLFEVIGDAYDISDADLLSYARFLIDNESFLPIDFTGSSVDFMLAKTVEEGRVFQIISYHEGAEVMIEYAVVVNDDTYASLKRFLQAETLLAEFDLDAGIMLDAANGLNENFWEFATTAIMDHLITLEANGGDTGELLNRYLEIFEDY